MKNVAPPSGGMPPPTHVRGPGGAELDLVALARAVCRRYYAEFADEDSRYGEAGRQWCVHDNQHILNWAALDVRGWGVLDEQVAWLARVLEARDFPLARLARNLDLVADVVRAQVDGGDAMADRLGAAARLVRDRRTFLR